MNINRRRAMKWAIRSVEFIDGDERAREFPDEESRRLLAGVMWGIARGRTEDGRWFRVEQVFSKEMYEELGAEQCGEILRAEARPPSD